MNFLGNIEGYFRESTLRIWSAIRVPPPLLDQIFAEKRVAYLGGTPAPLLQTKPSKYYLMGPFGFIVIIMVSYLDSSCSTRLESDRALELRLSQSAADHCAKYQTKFKIFSEYSKCKI